MHIANAHCNELTHPHWASISVVSKVPEIGTVVVLPYSCVVGMRPPSRVSDGAQTTLGCCGVCIGGAV